MSVDSLAARSRRPLAWVVAALFTLGAISAVAVEPASGPAGVERSGLGTAPPPPGPDGQPAAPAPGSEAGGSADPAPPDPPAPDDPAAPPLGPSAVPTAGVHRYEVQSTDASGATTVQEERRVVEVLSGDRTAGTVSITARLDGESQVSVLDWSPSGALVRSTRIESPSGTSRECAWDPPFPELGALAEGATWTIASTCRTPVGGVDTLFTITGGGAVMGQATVAFAGQDVRVWQIRRDRTTTIEADFGGRPVRQTAREEGTLFFDPGRGLVIRSDVTVTLDGAQSGETRRVSVLQWGQRSHRLRGRERSSSESCLVPGVGHAEPWGA